MISHMKALIKEDKQRGLRVLVGMKLTSDTNMVADVSSLLAVPGIQTLHVVTDQPYRTELPGVRYHYLPAWLVRIPGLRALGRIPLLVQVCRRERIDLVLGFHLTSYGVAALAAAYWLKIPCAVHLLGNDLDVYCRHGLLRPALMGIAAQADMLTTQGSRSTATLRSYGQNRVAVIPTVCTLPPHTKVVPSRRKYDMIYVGRFSKEKRPDRFVRIVGQIARQRPQVKTLMLGSGPMDLEIRQQIAVSGLEKMIEIVGWTDKVTDYLRESNVFLLTSDNDQLPLALLEAMSMGVVPVASDVGNICDAVDETTGYLVNRDDIAAYVSSVCALLDDENLRISKASASLYRATHVFSVESNSRRWSEVIATILRRRQCASPSKTRSDGRKAADL